MSYKRYKATEQAGCARCECDYQVGRCNDYYWVLIKQPVLEGSHEYIGMRTEQLATEIYQIEMSGVDPRKVRFIEYYPPENFKEGIFPDGFAEQLLTPIFNAPGVIKKLFGVKPKFEYFDSPRAHRPPFDNAVEFFSQRGISL